MPPERNVSSQYIKNILSGKLKDIPMDQIKPMRGYKNF